MLDIVIFETPRKIWLVDKLERNKLVYHIQGKIKRYLVTTCSEEYLECLQKATQDELRELLLCELDEEQSLYSN